MSRILVIAERQGAAWHRIAFEALAAGQQLGRETGLAVCAAVAGAGVREAAAELGGCQLDKVYAVEHAQLEPYTADGFTAAFEALVRHVEPAVVLLPHTYQVRDWAPKLATRFNASLVTDVTGFLAEAGAIAPVRQVFQGKFNAEYKVPGALFASIQAGAFRADRVERGGAPVEIFTPPLEAVRIRQRPEPPYRESARAVDLSAAEIIVAVGRGIKDKDNIRIVDALAEALGAELAASRPICDNGWLPMERQVGSSGQTVAPKLYIAVGISGAIQHLVGMKGSKTIIAINKDSDAPIFEAADYGIVGDLFEVVPALTEEVKKARG
jgi:electron transfer flavoprotein alpha subunit